MAGMSRGQLKLLPYAMQAAFNFYDKQHDPLCLPNTRVDILKQIMAWADGRDERCIFWLNGMAGIGSSPTLLTSKDALRQASSSPEDGEILAMLANSSAALPYS